MQLIDQYLPAFQFQERHTLISDLPPKILLDAVMHPGTTEDPWAKGFIRLRELPDRLLGRLGAASELSQRPAFSLDDFMPLGRDADRELAFGLLGRFWQRDYGLVRLQEPEAQFARYTEANLAKLVLLVYFAILFFALVVLGIVARLCGLSIWILIRILKDELILAYSTASSESVLPRIIEKMEAYGAPASITSFVVPTGYSFNLDGSTLYQSIAAIFIAQLYGIDLSIGQQLMLVLTLMVTSKGIAGVPGVSFVVLLATLGSVGIPLEGLAFIAGVDRVMDMARTALNVIGNALAVLVISRWEGMYDDAKGQRYWNSLPHWRSKEALPTAQATRS